MTAHPHLPGSPIAPDLAERIRERARALRLVIDGIRVAVTVSLGVTTLAPHDDSAEAILKRADRALCDAKRAGRDRVEAA